MRPLKLIPLPGSGPETRPYASRTRTHPVPPPDRLPAAPARLPSWPVTPATVLQMARDGLTERVWCATLVRSRLHVAAVCALVLELDARVRELERRLSDSDDTVVMEICDE